MPYFINIVCGIVFLIGSIWPLCAGAGIIRISKDPEKNDAWRKKWGNLLIICGIVLLACGAGLLILAL